MGDLGCVGHDVLAFIQSYEAGGHTHFLRSTHKCALIEEKPYKTAREKFKGNSLYFL